MPAADELPELFKVPTDGHVDVVAQAESVSAQIAELEQRRLALLGQTADVVGSIATDRSRALDLWSREYPQDMYRVSGAAYVVTEASSRSPNGTLYLGSWEGAPAAMLWRQQIEGLPVRVGRPFDLYGSEVPEGTQLLGEVARMERERAAATIDPAILGLNSRARALAEEVEFAEPDSLLVPDFLPAVFGLVHPDYGYVTSAFGHELGGPQHPRDIVIPLTSSVRLEPVDAASLTAER